VYFVLSLEFKMIADSSTIYTYISNDFLPEKFYCKSVSVRSIIGKAVEDYVMLF